MKTKLKVHLTTTVFIIFTAVIFLGYKDKDFVTAQKPKSVKTWVLGNREYRLNEAHFPKDALEIVRIVETNPSVFPEGFSVIVKNVSKKPIFFADFWVHFSSQPGEETQDAGGYDIKISYGSGRLINTTLSAEPGDIPAQPGEEFELKIDEADLIGLLHHLKSFDQETRKRILGKIVLRPQMVNFGDGTGCALGKCTSYFDKKQKGIVLFSGCTDSNCAKWSFNKDVYGCQDADCKIDTINSNIGGEDCGKTAFRRKFCSSIWGTINCNSAYLNPCAGWDDI